MAAKADFAAAEQARMKLAKRDEEVSKRISELQLDMAAHVVPLPLLCPLVMQHGYCGSACTASIISVEVERVLKPIQMHTLMCIPWHIAYLI